MVFKEFKKKKFSESSHPMSSTRDRLSFVLKLSLKQKKKKAIQIPETGHSHIYIYMEEEKKSS